MASSKMDYQNIAQQNFTFTPINLLQKILNNSLKLIATCKTSSVYPINHGNT